MLHQVANGKWQVANFGTALAIEKLRKEQKIEDLRQPIPLFYRR